MAEIGEVVRVHVDTDIGGDMDDLCALALLLKCPGVHISGITTVTEHGGRRAGYVRDVLALGGRTGAQIAAGAPSFMRRKADAIPAASSVRPQPDADCRGPPSSGPG